MQIKTMYYDMPTYQLVLTIVGAINLPPRENNQLRNPYCKLYILPDRSEKTKRRTKTVAGTLNPKWNQSFFYSPVKRRDLQTQQLQITVYDYDRIGSGEYVGEAIVDLSTIDLYERLQTYNLYRYDDACSSITSTSHEDFMKEHLSPPSSIVSRLSDSDISELDNNNNLDETSAEGKHRRRHRQQQQHGMPKASPAVRPSHYSSSDTLLVAPEESDEAQRKGLVRDEFQQDVEFQDFTPDESRVEPGRDVTKKRQLPRLPAKGEADSEIIGKGPRSKSQEPRDYHDRDPQGPRRTITPSQFERGRGPPGGARRPGPIRSDSLDRDYKMTEGGRSRSSERPLQGDPHLQRRRPDPNMDRRSRSRSSTPSTPTSAGLMQPRGSWREGQGDFPDRNRAKPSPSRGMDEYGQYHDPKDRSEHGRYREQSGKPVGPLSDRATYERRMTEMSGRRPSLADDSAGVHFESLSPRPRPASSASGYAGAQVLPPQVRRIQHREGVARIGSRKRRELSLEISDEALHSDVSELSDLSDFSKVSLRSTQSEKPNSRKNKFGCYDMPGNGKNDNLLNNINDQNKAANPSEDAGLQRLRSTYDAGSMSDSGILNESTSSSNLNQDKIRQTGEEASSEVGSVTRRPPPPPKHQPSIGRKVAALVGLSKRKSQSTSQIGEIGKKGKASFQRSEEVGAAAEMKMRMARQTSRESTDGSMASCSSDSSALWQGGSSATASFMEGSQQQLCSFIDGLGPGQLVGRQVLGSACLGQIQLGLTARKGCLEIEVIRARGLVPKSGTKMLPAPYIKVYMMDGKHCVEKQKTSIARRTLDPLYQQTLIFSESFNGKILQVTIWGDYGRLERKIFMGVVQIALDDINLTSLVIGWYKLFPHSSLVPGTQAVSALPGIGFGTLGSGSGNGRTGSTGGSTLRAMRQQTSVSSQESAYHSGSIGKS